MDYTRQIFEMIGVEPEERFKLKINGITPKEYYYIDDYLNVCCIVTENHHETCGFTLNLILAGNVQIIKIPHPTAEEQLAIDYARACGMKWIAKNKNNTVFAFEGKPIKGVEYWILTNAKIASIDIPISFLSWEDEEPFYIGQDETEEKEVCKYYSGGECMGQKYHPSVECKGDKSCCERDN